jgi:hypothetical protein
MELLSSLRFASELSTFTQALQQTQSRMNECKRRRRRKRTGPTTVVDIYQLTSRIGTLSTMSLFVIDRVNG